LERLQFSIPISVTINAPADLVWDTLTDIEAYPSTFDAVLAARPRWSANNSQSISLNSNSLRVGGGASSSSAAGSRPNGNTPTTSLKGSKWSITRISVVENQKYSAQVTITQCNQDENRRSFTMSTHQMLGATCSLKLIVEPVTGPPRNDQNNSHNQNNHNTSLPPQSVTTQPPPETNTVPSRTPSSSSTACCQITAIMTMIPYQIFVKLLGVMCCLCLLKSRARIAMECDLEDLVIVCEKKHAIATSAAGGTKEAAAATVGGAHNQELGSDEPNVISQQAAGNEADAGASSYVFSSGNQKGLQIILEANGSGC